MTRPAYLSRASLAAQLDVCEATPMRLDEAARVLLHGLVTKSTLRAAINRGDLIAERIGRILVVTPRAVLDWRRKCQGKVAGRTCTRKKAAENRGGTSETASADSQQAVALSILSGLGKPSPTTSDEPRGRILPMVPRSEFS